MGWDRKRRGAKAGYFYLSVRTPEGVKKIYFGRRTAGHLAATAFELRRQDRLAARAVTRVPDAGLVHLTGCTKLGTVWLDGTPVTDAGLVHLAGLADLTRLVFVNSKVTGGRRGAGEDDAEVPDRPGRRHD